MGLIFQPRPAASGRTWTPPPPAGPGADRSAVVRAALDAVVSGDASRFDQLFTDDVVFVGPHVSATSRAALEEAVGQPEDALSDVRIVVRSLDVVGDKVVVEWQLDARFTGALLFDDNVLIEPTGQALHLPGASFAEFRGERICAFRHYFDDSELLDGVAGVHAHLRWTARWRGVEGL